MANTGTSDGAIKGWETKHSGVGMGEFSHRTSAALGGAFVRDTDDGEGSVFKFKNQKDAQAFHDSVTREGLDSTNHGPPQSPGGGHRVTVRRKLKP